MAMNEGQEAQVCPPTQGCRYGGGSEGSSDTPFLGGKLFSSIENDKNGIKTMLLF